MKRCYGCGRLYDFLYSDNFNLCEYCYHRNIRRCLNCGKEFIKQDLYDIICDTCWDKEHNENREIEDCLE